MKNQTSILFILSIVVLLSCQKKNNVGGNIIIRGVLTDSTTQRPVGYAQIARTIETEGLCWGGVEWHSCAVTVVTHSTFTDSLGQFWLALPKDSIDALIHLQVQESAPLPASFHFRGGQEFIEADLEADTVFHNLQVRVDVQPQIVVRLEDDPGLELLPPNQAWRCVPEFFIYSGPTKSTAYTEVLTLANPVDTFGMPGYSTNGYPKKVYAAWTFRRPPIGGEILWESGIDSLVVTPNALNQYVIYY